MLTRGSRQILKRWFISKPKPEWDQACTDILGTRIPDMTPVMILPVISKPANNMRLWKWWKSVQKYIQSILLKNFKSRTAMELRLLKIGWISILIGSTAIRKGAHNYIYLIDPIKLKNTPHPRLDSPGRFFVKNQNFTGGTNAKKTPTKSAKRQLSQTGYQTGKKSWKR